MKKVAGVSLAPLALRGRKMTAKKKQVVKKAPNPKKLLSEFVAGMEYCEDIYNLFSGVRGPDNSSGPLSVLKHEITSRIRVIVFAKYLEVLGDTNPTQVNKDSFIRIKTAIADIKNKADIKNTDIKNHEDHFIGHLYSAVKATEEHRIWGKYAAMIIDILRG